MRAMRACVGGARVCVRTRRACLRACVCAPGGLCAPWRGVPWRGVAWRGRGGRSWGRSFGKCNVQRWARICPNSSTLHLLPSPRALITHRRPVHADEQLAHHGAGLLGLGMGVAVPNFALLCAGGAAAAMGVCVVVVVCCSLKLQSLWPVRVRAGECPPRGGRCCARHARRAPHASASSRPVSQPCIFTA